jgi:hypothetical protein
MDSVMYRNLDEMSKQSLSGNSALYGLVAKA